MNELAWFTWLYVRIGLTTAALLAAWSVYKWVHRPHYGS